MAFFPKPIEEVVTSPLSTDAICRKLNLQKRVPVITVLLQDTIPNADLVRTHAANVAAADQADIAANDFSDLLVPYRCVLECWVNRILEARWVCQADAATMVGLTITPGSSKIDLVSVVPPYPNATDAAWLLGSA